MDIYRYVLQGKITDMQQDGMFVLVGPCVLAHLLYKQNRKNTPPSSKLAVIMGKET